MPDEAEIRLSLTIKYELNGTLPIELDHILQQLPSIAESSHMLTGNTSAIVTHWDVSVTRVN